VRSGRMKLAAELVGLRGLTEDLTVGQRGAGRSQKVILRARIGTRGRAPGGCRMVRRAATT
jgi:hypothetical protein